MPGQRFIQHPLARRVAVGVFWGAVVASAAVGYGASVHHSQPFTSNQNTKMTHGLGLLGLGQLEHDWLVNTTNPFPVWAWAVAGLHAAWAEYGFYVGSFLIGGLFALGVSRLALALRGWPRAAGWRWWAMRGVVVFAAVVVVHSSWFKAEVLPRGKADLEAMGVVERFWRQDVVPGLRDWSGVAGQGIMSGELQPAMFGALAVLGLAAFAHRRDRWGAALLAGAALFHPTYLITTVALMVGVLVVLAIPKRRGPPTDEAADAADDEAEPDEDDGEEGGSRVARPWRHLLIVAAIYLVPTALMLAYTGWHFGATTPETKAAADAILAEFRIPHHALAQRWLFDDDAGLWFGFNREVWRKLVVVGLAIVVAGRWRIVLPMVVCFAVGVGLTWWAVRFESHRLMLIAPWRVSATLVPVALAVLLGRALQAWCWAWHGSTLALLPRLRPIARLGVVPGLHVALLLWVMSFGWGRLQQTIDKYQNRGGWPMYHAVREQATADDVYLVTSRWIDFRLKARAPIVITHKSHPIKDTEVLAWKARLDAVYAFEKSREPDDTAAALDHLVKTYGVTRVVLRQKHRRFHWLAEQYPVVYEDDFAMILDVRAAE